MRGHEGDGERGHDTEEDECGEEASRIWFIFSIHCVCYLKKRGFVF